MSGIRILNIPFGTTVKDIKIHFSNPKNGGSKLSRIYFPLLGNDAVLFYHDNTVSAKSFTTKSALQFKGNTLLVRDLPRKIFNKVTVELDQSLTKYLDENPSYLDELQFDGDLEMTFDTDTMNYIMTGDWFQVEWALAYLNNMCGEPANDTDWFDEKPETYLSKDIGNTNRVEEYNQQAPRNVVKDFKSPMTSSLDSENKFGDGFWKNEQKSHQENIPNKPTKYNFTGATSNIERFSSKAANIKPSFEDDFSDIFSTGFKAEMKNLFGQRGKIGLNDEHRYRKEDPDGFGENFEHGVTREALDNTYPEYCGSFDDNTENENASFLQKRFSQLGQRSLQRRQQGMSVSHSDFSDIPLKLDIHINDIRVLVTLNDLIEETTDAIVNPCNTDLSNIYGISKAIATAAGRDLQDECRQYISKKGHMVFGDVIHTCAGGMLKKQVGFVVHAAGPTWRDDQSEQSTHILTCTYLNCFQYANKHLWLKSISLPLISAGIHGCPLDASVQAFYDAVLLHTSDDTQSRHLQEIHLVSNDPDSTCAIIVVLNSLMDLDQTQSRSAAIERYQKNCAQFEFCANQFDMIFELETISDDSYSGDSETDQAQEEASDNINVESRRKNLEKIKVADDAVNPTLTQKDDVSTNSSDLLTVELVRNKPGNDSDVSDDDLSDRSDKDLDESESRKIPEDDEVPMGVVNVPGESQMESKGPESEISKTCPNQEKEEVGAEKNYSDDKKDEPKDPADDLDNLVMEEQEGETSEDDERKRKTSKIAESTV
ncbi:hypothetical protein KUTeg_016042 [Tegillarca granosa]|uniref:Macro domain-containing protein n=1 Tax=Tegillarca granosa TaxID=220873 RepID=A0ABQ9EJP3_TEGGR|nr:hypothetical protein KUTeg_016042 [Tegillarca granosa]